ncbi:hypothetical protein SAMN05192585_101101 [Acetanaerobacterium elongatum]|uniref:Uncharacterized protein n=1 Tax=Acetanaerobacterium elongatum TaxID=258515 RepID=A0A1G9U736_9FIRM|nr:hypothetical protein SAMN05192585_101101 [Acetanaerobacterium elongatum]
MPYSPTGHKLLLYNSIRNDTGYISRLCFHLRTSGFFPKAFRNFSREFKNFYFGQALKRSSIRHSLYNNPFGKGGYQVYERPINTAFLREQLLLVEVFYRSPFKEFTVNYNAFGEGGEGLFNQVCQLHSSLLAKPFGILLKGGEPWL